MSILSSIYGGMSPIGGSQVDLKEILEDQLMKSSFGVPAKKVLRWISRCSHIRVWEMSDVVCFGV